MPKFLPEVNAALTLNSAWLRNRVAELGLKQWWLAEQVGVDKKTVIRWMHGHVRSIQIGNATALAAVLGCRIVDLELPRESVDLASVDDQRAAAALLATSTLLDKLGPVGEWDVIERLLKAVAVPDLPLHVLGTLYHRLSIACWRQDKLSEAEVYNGAAFDAGQRCGDKALLAGAHSTRANLLHWRGECALAQQHCRDGLALHRFIDGPAIAALHNNLGMSLYETGEFDAGERELLAARALYLLDGTPMQRSINYFALAFLALRRGEVDAAQAHAQAAREHAALADYRRGIAMEALVRSDIHARRGESPQALSALADGKAAFARLAIVEGINFEFEGRVLRLLGRLGEAQRALGEGLRVAAAFPVEAGWLQHELVLTHRSRGDAAAARAAANEAIALFERLGAPRMAGAARSLVASMPPRVPVARDAKPLT